MTTLDPTHAGDHGARRRARASASAVAVACALGGCVTPQVSVADPALRERVMQTERAFAATMAARDLDAFSGFIDPEAVFFTGPEPLRGKEAVVAWWRRYFEAPEAPFSWAPDQVEVLASGTLAHSSGPVRTPDGTVVARFNSIWRRAADGAWKIVFDKGSPLEPKPPERP